jgi:predicted acylesterase/phospholipase RssA
METVEYNTLLFSGGGINGLVYLGIFKKIKELEKDTCKNISINVKRVCGVSIGSVFSLFYILGFTYEEMLAIVLLLDFKKLRKITFSNIIYKYGLDDCTLIMKWLQEATTKKIDKSITLKELYTKTGIDYQVICTSLKERKIVTFGHKEYPDMPVLQAIRMAISIPFLFTVDPYKSDIYVDAALLDNYPCDLFKENKDGVLGFNITSDLTTESIKINTFIDFIYSVLLCISERITIKNVTKVYNIDTVNIVINSEISSFVSFSIPNEKKLQLINAGYNAFCDWLRGIE